MAPLLFGQPLAQRIHQRLQAAQALDLRLLVVRQQLFGQLLQPPLGQGAGVQKVADIDLFKPRERVRERAVEAVDMAFVLDQHQPGQAVEPLDRHAVQAGAHALHQIQPFPQRDGNPVPAQIVQKGQEHQLIR